MALVLNLTSCGFALWGDMVFLMSLECWSSEPYMHLYGISQKELHCFEMCRAHLRSKVFLARAVSHAGADQGFGNSETAKGESNGHENLQFKVVKETTRNHWKDRRKDGRNEGREE